MLNKNTKNFPIHQRYVTIRLNWARTVKNFIRIFHMLHLHTIDFLCAKCCFKARDLYTNPIEKLITADQAFCLKFHITKDSTNIKIEGTRSTNYINLAYKLNFTFLKNQLLFSTLLWVKLLRKQRFLLVLSQHTL